MNEQWNKALDQVKDEYLTEAAGYRRKRHWPRVAAAAAAVLVLVIGWSVLHPEQIPATPSTPSQNTTVATVAPGGNSGGTTAKPPDKSSSINSNSEQIPHAAPDAQGDTSLASPSSFLDWFFDEFNFLEDIRIMIEDLLDWLFSGIPFDDETTPTEGIETEPAEDTTTSPTTIIEDVADSWYRHRHFLTYEELQLACQNQEDWFLYPNMRIPCLDDQPLEALDIYVYDRDLGEAPWTWYYVSYDPVITVRICLNPIDIEPGSTGAEALYRLCPDEPNLYNQDEYADYYSEIREVQITTSDGEKTALMKCFAGMDLVHLTFLQNGTLVTVSGPRDTFEADWLETFSLIFINDIVGSEEADDHGADPNSQSPPKQKYKVEVAPGAHVLSRINSEFAPGEEIKIFLPVFTHHYIFAYVNGVEQDIKTDELRWDYFIFTMPSEDVLIETELYGGSMYLPDSP